MKSNVGGADRFIRIVLGLVAIGIGVATKSWWGAVRLIPLATAAVGWCPVYLPFGISSCRSQNG